MADEIESKIRGNAETIDALLQNPAIANEDEAAAVVELEAAS